MQFDEQAYFEEMTKLLVAAKEKMKSAYPDMEIYTINVWTNPETAWSAVNFDTFKNSVAKREQQNEWSKKHYERLVAEGELEEAQLFLPNKERLYNPADFAFREIAAIRNQSFEENWEEQSTGKCWDVLEPVLSTVGQAARQIFSELNLHPQAELSVNSRRDWYDHTWAMHEQPKI